MTKGFPSRRSPDGLLRRSVRGGDRGPVAAQAQASGQVGDEHPFRVDALQNRSQAVQTRVHAGQGLGIESGVLGQVYPTLGGEHEFVELAEQAIEPGSYRQGHGQGPPRYRERQRAWGTGSEPLEDVETRGMPAVGDLLDDGSNHPFGTGWDNQLVLAEPGRAVEAVPFRDHVERVMEAECGDHVGAGLSWRTPEVGLVEEPAGEPVDQSA